MCRGVDDGGVSIRLPLAVVGEGGNHGDGAFLLLDVKGGRQPGKLMLGPRQVTVDGSHCLVASEPKESGTDTTGCIDFSWARPRSIIENLNQEPELENFFQDKAGLRHTDELEPFVLREKSFSHYLIQTSLSPTVSETDLLVPMTSK